MTENEGKPEELWKIIKNWVYQPKSLPQQAYV